MRILFFVFITLVVVIIGFISCAEEKEDVSVFRLEKNNLIQLFNLIKRVVFPAADWCIVAKITDGKLIEIKRN